MIAQALCAALVAPSSLAPVSALPTLLVAQAKPAGEEPVDFAERARRGRFSFDFAKAEIGDIVKAISEMTRKNFIIPEKVKSQRITILSPTKVNATEAYQVFLNALEVNGLSLVKAGKFYKVVEAKEAIKSPIPTCIGESDDECPTGIDQMVTVLIHVTHLDASKILPVLKGLSSKDSEITHFQPTNALIISEYALNLDRLREVLAALDQPGFDDELQMVQIDHATASEISEKLTQIFDVAKDGGVRKGSAPQKEGAPPAATGSPEEEVQISKIIADDRTNQLIIKASRRSFEGIKSIIAKLDVPITEGEGKVHVYYLENAKADELASTLSSLAQGQATSQRKAPTTAAKEPKAPAAAAGPESAVLFQGEVKITADKSTNSLIVMASSSDYRALKKLIEKLDLPRRQVYVEAAILEVTVTDNNQFGLNWHGPIKFNDEGWQGQIGGSNTAGFIQSAFANKEGLSPTLAPNGLLTAAAGSVVGIVGEAFTIPGTEIEIPSFGVVLRWLESSSNANILSTPHILTTDNEEATIEVGQKIPFLRGTSLPPNLGALTSSAGASGAAAASGLAGLGNLFSSTDRIDVSLTLKITPHVNERNKVRLEIDQKLEDLVGREEQTQQPITANRATKTVVVIDDQQSVVIGGLMRDRVTESDSKIPILGDLPLVGWLFKKHSKDVEKVNLLLVLTPYIIRDHSDFQRIFERKMKEYEDFAALYYGHLRQYRAHIDYARKVGPLAKVRQTIDRELNKIENGGEGDGEMLITPSRKGAPLPQAAPIAPETIVVPAPVEPDAAPVPAPEAVPPVSDSPPEAPQERPPEELAE